MCISVCMCARACVCVCYEGYEESSLSPTSATASIRHDLLHRGWESSAPGPLAILYLIGKAKSIAKGSWLWRGITALPQPFLPKKPLKIASRANATFLRLLGSEIPYNFLSQSINELAPWYH